MKKFYRIAGHVVGLNMGPSDPLWDRLDNLSPFAYEGGGRPVLEIETAERLPEEPVEVIYTAETEDFPRIEIGRSQGRAWRISLSPLHTLEIDWSDYQSKETDFDKISLFIDIENKYNVLK